MSLLDWNSPEERAAYFRKKGSEYRKSHPRLTLTFSEEEFKWVEGSAKHYGTEKVSRHVKGLALEAAKLGLGAQVEAKPSVPEEVCDEMLYLLHNSANNLNQIAYQLNLRAKEENRTPVAGEEESGRILDELYRILRDLETELLPLITQSKGS